MGGVVARAFAEHGGRIAAIGRRVEELTTLVESLPGGPGRHVAFPADLADLDALKAAAPVVRERLGPPAVLIHLAGGYRGEAGIIESPSAEWPAMLEVNLLSAVNSIRAFLPAIREAEGGRIVTFSSPFASTPGATGAAYAASKAALETLTLSVAKELAGTAATANVIVVRTIGADKPHHTRPEEIVAALLWLCSLEAGVVNGQRIRLVGRG